MVYHITRNNINSIDLLKAGSLKESQCCGQQYTITITNQHDLADLNENGHELYNYVKNLVSNEQFKRIFKASKNPTLILTNSGVFVPNNYF